MNYTQHYQLPQWVEDDRILRTDFNDMTSAIDAALKTNADGLAAETAARTAGDAAKGNCRLYTATYTGTGTTGYEKPNTLTFPAQPFVVLVASVGNEDSFLLVVRGTTESYADGKRLKFTWSGNTLRWYSTVGGAQPSQQLNTSGVTYQVVALIASDAA